VQPPAALAAPTGTAGQAAVTLKWVSTDTSITGYSVQAYKPGADGTPVADGQPVETTDKTVTIRNLTAETPYTFTVKAKNAGGYGPESAQSAALTPAAIIDTVTISSAKYKAGSDFRIIGTASVVGAAITPYRVNADGSIGTAIPTATTTVTAESPPPPAESGRCDSATATCPPRTRAGSSPSPTVVGSPDRSPSPLG
jgi:hypothetical protein